MQNAKLIFLSLFILFIALFQSYLKSRSTNQQHLFISSAYRVTEYGKTFIRVLAMAENGYNQKLICHYNNYSKAQKALTWRIGGYPSCKWSAYFIECPQEKDQKGAKEFYIGVESQASIHKVTVQTVDQTKRRFVVCFSRMFTFERWQIAVAALHLYKLHGINLMLIPIASVLHGIYELLEEYEKAGYVKLKRAPKLPVFAHFNNNPNAEVEWFNQVLGYNECLYDYRDTTDFIAFLDIDDIMFPRFHTNLADEIESISRLNPDVASFEFLWSFSSAHLSSNPLNYKLTQMIKTTNFDYHLSFGKSIVRPQFINQGYIHHPEADKKELLYGYKDRIFSNSTFVVHYRDIIFDRNESSLTSNAFFANDTNYDKLDDELNAFFTDRPKALEIFLRLPTTFTYYDELSKCYENFGFEINFSGLKRCPSPLGCLPKNASSLLPCVVLENKYDLTQISDNFQISSVVESKLVLKPNCLM